MCFRKLEELRAGLGEVLASPKDAGFVEMLVRRPGVKEREVLESGTFEREVGLVGDNWRTRGSSSTADGQAHPGKQVAIMNARVLALVAGTRERWPLAGDKLVVDFDLSPANVPPGSRLRIGTAEFVVSESPHTGCNKFVERFGVDAMRFVASKHGRELNLRGINARVVRPGEVRVADRITRRAAGE